MIQFYSKNESVLAVFLAACSSPQVEITSKPIAGSPSAAREQLEPLSRQVLTQEGLSNEFRKDPDATVRTLHQRYQKDGGAERLVALAELCGTLGSKWIAKNPNAAAEYYLEAGQLSRAGVGRERMVSCG